MVRLLKSNDLELQVLQIHRHERNLRCLPSIQIPRGQPSRSRNCLAFLQWTIRPSLLCLIKSFVTNDRRKGIPSKGPRQIPVNRTIFRHFRSIKPVRRTLSPAKEKRVVDQGKRESPVGVRVSSCFETWGWRRGYA